MERPDQWPNVPYAAFLDGVGPVINEDFLNRLQRGFQDITGGLYQRSATIISDDFTELTYANNKFGQFDIIAATNVNLSVASPLGISQHGVWHVAASASALTLFLALDAQSWLTDFDFTFSGKARIDAKAELNTAATPGFGIGMRDAAGSQAYFAAGNDQNNWILYLDATPFDTGVPAVDGVFYEFQLCRIDGTAYAFIDGNLVVTALYNADLHGFQRYISINAPTATAGNGFYIDYHRVWYQR